MLLVVPKNDNQLYNQEKAHKYEGSVIGEIPPFEDEPEAVGNQRAEHEP